MSGVGTAMRTLGDVLVAPGAAWRRLSCSNAAWLCTCVCTLHAVILAVQARIAQQVAAGELDDLAGDVHTGVAVAAIAVLVVAPVATAARALVTAAALGFAAPAPWRLRLALALALEAVPLVENAAATAVLWASHPAGLASLHTARLRAGLDLLCEPQPGFAGALLASASVFSVWWAVLFALSAQRVLGASAARAVALAAAAWAARVAWRAAWIASP